MNHQVVPIDGITENGKNKACALIFDVFKSIIKPFGLDLTTSRLKLSPQYSKNYFFFLEQIKVCR